MSCKNCYKCVFETRCDGSQRLICSNDINGIGVNGFHKCIEYKEKCIKCARNQTPSHEFPCFLCSSLSDKPYYIEEVKENG